MSYSLQVLRDNPIGYWSLSNTNKDITRNANAATISGTYITPPIIANGGHSLKVTNVTTVSISNSSGIYECFSKNHEDKDFTIAFWFSLNNQLNGSGSDTYINEELVLFSIKNGSVIIGKIVYNYRSNTIRYIFPGNNNTDAYSVVKDLDKQYYVVATYSDKKTSISVNGHSSGGGNVSDYSKMSAVNKDAISFSVSDSTIPINSSFIIGEIAFYNYLLSDEQIRRHIVWATNDEKPNFQASISPNTSLFSFLEDSDLLGYSATISGLDFSNMGQVNKLNISQSGLSSLNLNTPKFNNFLNSSASYTINTSSGINWSSLAGLDIDFIPEYFNMTTGFTIYTTINRTSTGSYSEYIFGITDIDGKNLFLEYDVPDGKTNYHLKLYDPYTGSTVNMIDLSSGLPYSSAKVSNVAVKFLGNTVSIYTSDNSGKSASSSNFSLSLGRNSILTVGNSYHSPKNLYSYISNFGITDNYYSSITSTPFGNLDVFLIPLTSSATPFLVKQRGTWTHQIPTSTIPFKNFYGTAFDWKTMDNCKVYYSIDSGSTFNLIGRHETAFLYNKISVPQNISVKVQIDKDYVNDDQYQYFNNLYYIVYDSINLKSDGDIYVLSASSSSANANFTLSNGINNILARQENFGIKFGGSVSGNALITTPSSTSYNAIEFWYRPDVIKSGSSNYILNNATGSATSPAIWLNSTAKFQSLGGTLYINGASVANNSYGASAKEVYHVALVLSASNSSNLYLNGNGLGSGAIRGSGTFGYFQIWNNTPSPLDISDRYSQFIGKTIAVVSDNNSTKLYSTLSKESYLVTKLG